MDILKKFKGLERAERARGFAPFDYERFQELYSQTSSVPCFEIDGRVFIGNRDYLVKQYTLSRPSKKFITWLVDLGITEVIK